ncbi:MAG TPA: creatininase family protein, partial [Thermomicrobiales bacterium]|nr:creatininase family protein [Thermomicrobiales bacterium]
ETMVEAERVVELAKMTSPEAGVALARAEVAIIPVGATEQHGPNLSLETDTAIAAGLARRIAAALYPRAVVAPALPYGVSHHHMRFPGTMTISPDAFQAVLLDVARSLRQHGARRLFIVDGHAGNQGALDVLMTKLRFEHGIPAAYLFYFTIAGDVIQNGVKTERWGHACELEASLGLALQPDIVHREALQPGAVRAPLLPFTDPREPQRLGVPLWFDELTANGALGDARQATAAFGEDVAATVVARATAFLERFMATEFEATTAFDVEASETSLPARR